MTQITPQAKAEEGQRVGCNDLVATIMPILILNFKTICGSELPSHQVLPEIMFIATDSGLTGAAGALVQEYTVQHQSGFFTSEDLLGWGYPSGASQDSDAAVKP